VEPLRGNIDTRLKKLRAGEFDAVILAMAGLLRAGLFDPSYMKPIPVHSMLPAAGQGALALQCRCDDANTRAVLAKLNDPTTAKCVAAERAVVLALDGDCHSPIAALATFHDKSGDGQFHLQAAVGQPGGEPPVIRAEVSVKQADFSPCALAAAVVTALRSQS